MYCIELELPDGSSKKLKGKVDTGAQVNLMNYLTFREIFGKNAEKLLYDSQVKLTGYGGKRFRNNGKFCIDCVRHKDVAMKIIKIMCEEETDCNDCHGPYDVSEVKDGTVGEKKS